jgi:hypothetical protein
MIGAAATVDIKSAEQTFHCSMYLPEQVREIQASIQQGEDSIQIRAQILMNELPSAGRWQLRGDGRISLKISTRASTSVHQYVNVGEYK